MHLPSRTKPDVGLFSLQALHRALINQGPVCWRTKTLFADYTKPW